MAFLILGAGSWGTAFAVHLSRLHAEKNTVYLWGRDALSMQAMQQCRENKRYLPNIIFPDHLNILVDIDTAIPDVQHVIIAVPSHAFQESLLAIKPFFSIHKQTLFWITKGLASETHNFLHQTAQKILGNDLLFGIISGPSFAQEVAQAQPTAVTLAGSQPDWVTLFHTSRFRVYFSTDIIGVQLGGAVKNVLAIATGIAEGFQLGANAQAALITRGLAEMMRLGIACGAKAETLMGLSGIGDLLLTGMSHQSRNRRFGIALAEHGSREQAEKTIQQVIEGISATQQIYHMAKKYDIDMPITAQIYQVLYNNLSVHQAIDNLLLRSPTIEHHA